MLMFMDNVIKLRVLVTAASVVGAPRRGSSIANTNEIILKEKLSITLKETVNKDAPSVRNVAIRSGFVMKRNEQGDQLSL